MFGFWSDPSFKIYVCHLMSSWGDRCWSFAVGLYLVILYDDSLILTAIFGFSTSISVIGFGAFIGKWIDKSERITIAKIAIVVQNVSVICSASILITMLQFETEIEGEWNGHLNDFLLALFIIFAVLGELGSVAVKIALEKDWIVVLSQGEESKLARMNTIMRTINLAAFILAPMAIGQLLTYWSPIAGAVFVAGWNFFSGIAEFQLLNYIYRHFPRLEKKPIPEISIECPQDERSSKGKEEIGWFREAMSGWRDYYNHQVRNAGVGLALTYMSVLAFDNITTGHLYSQGLSESLISIIIGIGAGCGILGTLCYPLLRKWMGKLRTGLLGFSTLTLLSILCVASVFVDSSPFRPESLFEGTSWFSEIGFETDDDEEDKDLIELGSISRLFNGNHTYEIMLISGLIVMRYGQWMSDLSVTQIFQEEIPELRRGIINGVQDGLNQFMNLLKFFLVICLPRDETFGYLIILTWIFTFIGFISFAVYAFQSRNREKQSQIDLIAEKEEKGLESPNKLSIGGFDPELRRLSNLSNISLTVANSRL